MKGKFSLDVMFEKETADNLFISEITLAELKFGVEKSEKPDKNKRALDIFLTGVQILPIFHSLDIYAKEKAKLRIQGLLIDDFDILIGATSINHKMVMVTNNISHLARLEHIIIEDWTATIKK